MGVQARATARVKQEVDQVKQKVTDQAADEAGGRPSAPRILPPSSAHSKNRIKRSNFWSLPGTQRSAPGQQPVFSHLIKLNFLCSMIVKMVSIALFFQFCKPASRDSSCSPL